MKFFRIENERNKLHHHPFSLGPMRTKNVKCDDDGSFSLAFVQISVGTIVFEIDFHRLLWPDGTIVDKNSLIHAKLVEI